MFPSPEARVNWLRLHHNTKTSYAEQIKEFLSKFLCVGAQCNASADTQGPISYNLIWSIKALRLFIVLSMLIAISTWFY